MQNGQYKNDIGKTRINVFCNTEDNFSIYAIGYSNNTLGNNTMLASGVGSIPTGTATSGDTSQWAMKLEAVTGTGIGTGPNAGINSYTPTIISPFTNFTNVPDNWTKVAEVASVTGTTNQAAIDASYAVYMSLSQPSGSYTGKVRYTVLHPASAVPNQPIATSPGKIGYVPNANGLVIDTMADQEYTGYTSTVDNFTTPLTPNSEATLWASNFKRPGYGFAGWSTTYDYSDPNGFYGPNQTITTPTNLDQKGLTLYAIWIPSAGTLQNWTGCNSLTTGQVTALTDTRDNNTYAVAKLADNKCWMIENLRLGGNTAINLTPDNTTIYSNLTLPASTDTFTITSYNSIEMNASNTVNPVANMTASTDAAYSYGNYYSFAAAVGTTADYGVNNTSVTTSICPKGWRLPIGGNKNNEANNEYWDLVVAKLNNNTSPTNYPNNIAPYYNGDTESNPVDKSLRTYPNNFVHSGYVLGSSLRFQSVGGYTWSSTVSSSTNDYILGFNRDYVAPGTGNGNKSFGYSVRCVSDPPVTISDAYQKSGKSTHNGYYKMQDMSDSICGMVNVLDEPGQTQLIDTRDNKVYWATKLQDGKCWMTQNLDLNLSTSTALTNADTDLNTVASWTPMRSTINAVTNASTSGSITGWTNDYNTPYSIDTGDYYWKNEPFYDSSLCNKVVGGVNYQGCNYVTKADASWKNYFATTPYASNGAHGHVGNYYNWSTAVASNDTSAYTADTMANIANNPPNSICPKGWRLPTVTSASPDYTQANSRDEFSRLAYLYDNYTGNTSISSEGLEKAPLYMSRTGRAYAGLDNVGYYGYYWSSTASSGTFARALVSYSTMVYPQHEGYRFNGASLRCLAR
ncbi:hypothetical protein IKF03_00965 [Candidatus Saccharibacteria bacterium]|nr:hypothetical protein [Candidatus Saccharibacteria bacterium]